VDIWVPGVDEIPMSVSDYHNGELRIVFRVVGEGTKALTGAPRFVGVKGPLGRGFDASKYSRVLFVAGGTGVAPLPYLARILKSSGGRVDVVWGVRTASELFDIRRIAGFRSLGEVFTATEDGSAGFRGTAVDLALRISERGGWDVVVGVGPKPMLRALCRALSKRFEVYVSLEAYVKCGLGACGSCVLKPLPLLLCVHGPVFRCEEVLPHLEAKGAEA